MDTSIIPFTNAVEIYLERNNKTYEIINIYSKNLYFDRYHYRRLCIKSGRESEISKSEYIKAIHTDDSNKEKDSMLTMVNRLFETTGMCKIGCLKALEMFEKNYEKAYEYCKKHSKATLK